MSSGFTGKILARCSVFKDGVVRWGMSREGMDHTGIKVTINPFYENGVKQFRIGFYHDKGIPIWWGPKHRDALDRAMYDKFWSLAAASESNNHAIIEGSQWELPSGYAGDLTKGD